MFRLLRRRRRPVVDYLFDYGDVQVRGTCAASDFGALLVAMDAAFGVKRDG